MKVIGVIPARYGSTRLPGKPLKMIAGKQMLLWVYERCRKSKKLDDIYVATDDERIQDFCRENCIPCAMTRVEHRTAANRLYEFSEKVQADFYVQINGDEPLIDVDLIDRVVPTVIPSDTPFGTNIVCPITDELQLTDVSNIKVVFDCNNNMKYMSRGVIPYKRTSNEGTYYKHVGIIGYNKLMLDFYNLSTPGPLECDEGIDTLRFIDYDKTLKAIVVERCDSLSVDTEQDLEYVRCYMEKLQNE